MSPGTNLFYCHSVSVCPRYPLRERISGAPKHPRVKTEPTQQITSYCKYWRKPCEQHLTTITLCYLQNEDYLKPPIEQCSYSTRHILHVLNLVYTSDASTSITVLMSPQKQLQCKHTHKRKHKHLNLSFSCACVCACICTVLLTEKGTQHKSNYFSFYHVKMSHFLVLHTEGLQL